MKKKTTLSLLLVVSLFLGCCFFSLEVSAGDYQPAKADEEDNPFLNRKQELKYEDEAKLTIKGMNLTLVLYSRKSSKAMIDGRIVEIGDIIDNKEIVEIKSEKVVFKDYLGKEYVLKMDNILSSADSNEDDLDEY